MKLTPDHGVPRLRMRAAVPPLPSYAFNAWSLVKHRGQLYVALLPGKVIQRRMNDTMTVIL